MGLAILVIACVAGTVYLWAIPYLVKEILEKKLTVFLKGTPKQKFELKT